MNIIPHWIHGAPIEGTGAGLPVYNPARGTVSANVTVADSDLVDQAVTSAQNAFTTWSLLTATQRTAIIFRFKQLLDQHMDELAAIVTQEHGKTLLEAKGSVQRGIDVVNQVCGLPQLLTGRYLPHVASDIDSYSMRQPLGVCVGITPFNFPAMIPLWMFPMAIACGNTFILKPSEKDPSCALKLAQLAKQAGVPDGVINVLHGNHLTVDLLLKHPGVQAVSFVGSSQVAEHVYHTAITHHKRAQAFGGAKNHAVVMPDADMAWTADSIVQAAYGSAGERCMAISVAVAVGDDTADRLIAAMTPKIQSMTIGDGTDPKTILGPLITDAHRNKVRDYVKVGQSEGAKLVLNLQDNIPKACEAGFFMGPCLFDHVMPNMHIYREEIFGPVLCVMRVKTKEEALACVNAHEYGNGTAIFTRDGYAANWFAEKVHVGMVGINVPVPVPVAQHSFGGWKRSSFGDTSMFGPEVISFYTKLKTVTARWTPKEAS